MVDRPASLNARLIARRSLLHYRRTNIAVVLGVACAVTVLSGALLVGESVRGSLRAMSTARLGNADVLVTSETFFREQLASDLLSAGTEHPAPSTKHPAPSTQHAAPLVILYGTVTHEASGRRASRVAVYGVDDRFFAFHGAALQGPRSAATLLSGALARELGANDGDSLLIRVARPSDIPLESLHGRRDEGGRAIRSTSAGVLGAEAMGDFAVSASQGAQLSVFLPLSRMQRELGVEGRVNALLAAGRPDLRAAATPADLGLRVSAVDGGALAVESDAGLITSELARDISSAASKAGMQTVPVLTYLANEMRAGDRAVPYSLITAVDPAGVDEPLLGGGLTARVENPIVLNDWAARDLGVKIGDRIEVSYYRWLDAGRLVTERASFTLAAITPIDGLAADRRLAPDYPGISDTDSLSDWDPPFPVDLSLVRQIDEDYWDRYRTTPKAFIPLATGQQLWRSRWGSVTSLRASGGQGTIDERRAQLETRLRESIDPLAHGLRVIDVRAESADASEGSADFGLYFLGFSYVLVVSALLLAALFFRLGVEQRLREIGLLTAVGFTRRAVRRMFLIEGLALAIAGSILGVAGAVGYAAIVLHGLRTWWQGAVNTTALSLHLSATPLAAGAIAGIVIAWLCIVLSIRGLRRLSPRSLLAGQSIDALALASKPRRRTQVVAALAAAGAITLVVLGFLKLVPPAGAFFGAGLLLLMALLAAFNLMLRRTGMVRFEGAGRSGLARFGLRNASWRPGRSVLSAALVAAAVFLIVSVDAFRRGGDEALEPKGGAGGFALIGEAAVPIVHDLNTPEGREDAGLILDGRVSSALTFYQMRLRPGDDTSCVNLYKPKRPRVAGVGDAFIAANRFTFAASLAATGEQSANPWTLLRADAEPFAAVVDATSLQYVLHAAVGDEIVIDEDSSRPIRLRIVGSLRDSALQGEIIVGEASFKKMFPDEPGYRMALVDVAGDTSHARLTEAAGHLEAALDRSGFDAQLTGERLAAYHRVENTYLTTFQSLGALGLLLGTMGLATVLARNVLERRRELALLRAVGYERRAVGWVVLAEHLALLLAGMLAGVLTAAVAILPAISERGFNGGWTLPAWLLVIFVAGAAVTAVAARAALRQPLLSELRSE